MKQPHDPNELIAVVDEQDNIVDQLPRKIVHEKKLLHRETALIIINSNGQILVQKRANNNKYDSSVAGHFEFNDNYEDAIIREAKEELNLDISKQEIKEIKKIKIESNNNIRFVKFFELKKDISVSNLIWYKPEVASVAFLSKDELLDIINNSPDKMSNGFRIFLQDFLKLQWRANK